MPKIDLEVNPSPSPCYVYRPLDGYYDCFVCGWCEEAHDLEVDVWYRSIEDVDTE